MERDHESPERAGGNALPRAIALDNDLFFSVKVADTLRHAGYETRTVRRLDDFLAALAAGGASGGRLTPVVALVNTAARGIDWHAAVAAAREAGVPVIAFGPHVDLAAQEEARRSGATAVISNSKLASDLPGVVARTLHRKRLHAAEIQPDGGMTSRNS